MNLSFRVVLEILPDLFFVIRVQAKPAHSSPDLKKILFFLEKPFKVSDCRNFPAKRIAGRLGGLVRRAKRPEDPLQNEIADPQPLLAALAFFSPLLFVRHDNVVDGLALGVFASLSGGQCLAIGRDHDPGGDRRLAIYFAHGFKRSAVYAL